MKIFFYVLIIYISCFGSGMPKEYYEIKNTQKMKQYFFNYILKIAKAENQKILKDRYFVINVYNNLEKIDKNSQVIKRFNKITKRYKIKKGATLKEYLLKIDIIPPSLILAQAAIESGWGKSRFFKEANNIFGQWTWSGNGLTPSNRDNGKKHKIKIFNSLEESVRGYMINLNVGWGYKEFRKLRYQLRLNNSKPNGLILSETLKNYSQKKETYTQILKDLIIRSNLAKYDTQQF